MDVETVGTRGTLFTFFELDGYPTSVYCIDGKTHSFLCDTFLGSDPMKRVCRYLFSAMGKKPVVVFNSHYHWDHIWGNCAFPSSPIIAHARCRERVLRDGAKELKEYEKYVQGSVTVLPPSITFTEQLCYPEEGIEFFYSPGHTECSASCYDTEEDVVFVGDNVERPIPYLLSTDLERYRTTLEAYLEIDPHTYVLGHGKPADRSLVEETLAYVEAFIADETEKYEKAPYKEVHTMNLRYFKR